MYSILLKVRYSECDKRAQLTLASLINYLQDISAFLCESGEYGFTYLRERHLAWFVLGWHIEMTRMPLFLEDICFHTWLSESKATYVRNSFALEDETGSFPIRASALYALIDKQTGRPVRIPSELTGAPEEHPDTDLGPMRRKIEVTGNGTPLASVTVTDHHLDLNDHMNNGQYVQIADDTIRQLDPDFKVGTLRVQYIRPAKLNDTISPVLHVKSDTRILDLAAQDGKSWAVVEMAPRTENAL